MITNIEFSTNFNRINKEFTRFINSQLDAQNITRSEVPILLLIYKNHHVSQEFIAKHLNFNQATITRAIKRLENKNLISRVHDKEDKRKKIVLLTSEGKSTVLNLFEIQDEYNKMLFYNFTREEIDTLNNLLDKLFENLNKQ